MGDYGIHFDTGITGDWDTDDLGNKVPPAFLEHIGGSAIDLALERSMLAAFGIATVCKYPNNGELGNVVMGFSGGGVDIFVPETKLEDARNILSGSVEPESDCSL